MTWMSFFKPVQSAYLLGVLVLSTGCSTKPITQETIPKVSSDLQTIEGVSNQKFGARSFFLVGLQPYLGKGFKQFNKPDDFRLKSAGQPLILKDSSGLVHQAAEITISWRKILLKRQHKIVRQVSGPFASFESAFRLAQSLRKKGIPAEVAHPRDWEVWVPQGISLPVELNFLPYKETISFEVKPVLNGDSGNHVLTGPLQIESPDGLYWKQGLYLGPFWLKSDAYGTWTFIEQVPIERYLHGVVPYEIGPNAPIPALSSQAVLARTWALANAHRFAIDGYHLCSDTQCQVYKNPSQVSARVKDAIATTAGQYLAWNNQPIHAVYHATNGGVMASVSEAWFIEPLPYLRPQLDGSRQWKERFSLPLEDNSKVQSLLDQQIGAYGSNHPRFRWNRTYTALELKKALNSLSGSDQIPVGVKVMERGESGRVLSLEILASDNQRRVLRRDEIRRTLRLLPSTLFVVKEIKPGIWQFFGGGFGHGAGLSQAGAIDLATQGWKTFEILSHYYPGTSQKTLPDLPKAP